MEKKGRRKRMGYGGGKGEGGESVFDEIVETATIRGKEREERCPKRTSRPRPTASRC